MKTTKLIVLAVVCFIFGLGICMYAQNSTSPTKQYVERTINGQTYVYDTSSHWIQNKKNQIHKEVEYVDCRFRAEYVKSLESIFDEIFLPERKEELKGSTLPIRLYCDSSGKVLEIEFRLRDGISMLTLEEVNALENAFLKSKILEIIRTCPDKKYYRLNSIFRWK
jgi:hypothetical protein